MTEVSKRVINVRAGNALRASVEDWVTYCRKGLYWWLAVYQLFSDGRFL